MIRLAKGSTPSTTLETSDVDDFPVELSCDDIALNNTWQDLPSAIRSRGNDLYVTKEELVKVVQWKLWVGAVRPNLLRFAKETNASQVSCCAHVIHIYIYMPSVRRRTHGKAHTASVVWKSEVHDRFGTC